MRVNGPFFATSVDRPYVEDLPSLAPAPGHPVIPCARVKGRRELDTAAGQAAWGSVVPALWSFMLAVLTPVAYIIGARFKPGPRADAAEFTHRDRW
jgi:hypothetical protein